MSRLECENLNQTVTSLRQTLNNSDVKGRDIQSELVAAQVAESLYRQELDKINKHHEVEERTILKTDDNSKSLKKSISACVG